MRTLSVQTAALVVVLVAFELLLLRERTPGTAELLVIFSLGLVLAASVLAWFRRGFERRWWLGFAIGGWAYLGLTTWVIEEAPILRVLVIQLEPDGRSGLADFLKAASALLIQAAGVAGGLLSVAAFLVGSLIRGGRGSRAIRRPGPREAGASQRR